MQRWYSIMLVGIVTVIVAGPVLAATVGSPGDPALLQGETPFQVGVDWNHTFKREMEEGSEIQTDWLMGKLSYRIDAARASIYGLLGSAFGESKNGLVLGTTRKLSYDIDGAFAWGTGLSWTAWETQAGSGLFRFWVDGRYQQFNADTSSAKLGGDAASVNSLDHEQKEWHVALGMTYVSGPWAPYVGIRYSDVDIDQPGQATFASGTVTGGSGLRSDLLIGTFVGLDYKATDQLAISVEGRLVDEYGISVGATYRF